MQGNPVYIFSGSLDTEITPPPHQEAQRDYYDHFGGNVKYVSYPIGHSVPSVFAGDHWSVEDTSFDTTGDMFEFIYTNL